MNSSVEMVGLLRNVLMGFVPFLFALCFHEYAHGQVAKWLGDRTAERLGRLSMNPLVHADPLGTFVLPILSLISGSPLFFGWALPVPVDPRNLRGRNGMFWVALAGPLSNVLLALLATVALGFAVVFIQSSAGEAVALMLKTFIGINIALAVFNLIPLHPLDGGKVIEPFIPHSWNVWLLENQQTLNIALIVVLLFAGNLLFFPVALIQWGLLKVSALIASSLM